MQDRGAQASLSTVALRRQRRLSLLNSEHIHLQGIDFDVGRGKANVLPEYYRKLGPGRNRQRAATQVFPIRDGIVKEEGAQIGPV